MSVTSRLARILVGLGCDYECSYCCNKALRHTFKSIAEMKLDNYQIVGVSGGEPLIASNVDATVKLVKELKKHGKTVILYTNLSTRPPDYLIELVDGWTIGYHPSQTDFSSFLDRVRWLRDIGATSIRVKVCDKDLISVSNWMSDFDLRAFVMDDCDRSHVEDIFLM